MLKKIICFGALLVMTFSLVACGNAIKASLSFETEQELRERFPQYYYFDFDLPEMELLWAKASSNTIVKPGWDKSDSNIAYTDYNIIYAFENARFGEFAELFIDVTFNVNISKDTANYVSIEIIDNIECFLNYVDWKEESLFRVSLAFELDNTIYILAISNKISSDQIPEFVDYVLSVLKPVIENRHKG